MGIESHQVGVVVRPVFGQVQGDVTLVVLGIHVAVVVERRFQLIQATEVVGHHAIDTPWRFPFDQLVQVVVPQFRQLFAGVQATRVVAFDVGFAHPAHTVRRVQNLFQRLVIHQVMRRRVCLKPPYPRKVDAFGDDPQVVGSDFG